MAGETDRVRMIAGMRPHLLPGEVVFVAAPQHLLAALRPRATVVEPEGVSAVVDRDDADEAGLEYGFVGAWITLRLHSALDGVGLTAAVSTALADAGIAANVIAGLHHDHVVVPHAEGARAVAVLDALAASARRSTPR